jgi:hypothetical protein
VGKATRIDNAYYMLPNLVTFVVKRVLLPFFLSDGLCRDVWASVTPTCEADALSRSACLVVIFYVL